MASRPTSSIGDEERKLAEWFSDGVHDGSIVEFALIAVTKDGGRCDAATRHAPRTLKLSKREVAP